MITGLHSKIAFSLVTSSKRKKIIENKLLKYQYGAKRSGSESVIHIIQQILIQNPDYDLFSADALKAFYKLNRDIALETLKSSFPEVFNMFMEKYNNSADAFVYGTAQGVLKFQQTEGGSPGSPEMSFLYELGISSFINNIADLLRSNDQSHTDKGTIAGFIDDFYWAAPFPKMIEIIQFVQRNGPKYGYTLNMQKCTYLMASSNTFTENELAHRLDVITQLGIPISNVKVHPNNQQNISSELYNSRLNQWGFKVLGAYVGTTEYIENSLNTKMHNINEVADILLKYPNTQARYNIHRYCFNEKINYWLRTQFPQDCKKFLASFKKTQTTLIASYHGIYDRQTINDQLPALNDLYTRVSFPIANGGLALRCIDSVFLTAFLCSMAASAIHLSNHFPLWIQTSTVDNVHQITSINETISRSTSDQLMHSVQEIQSKVTNDPFDSLDSLALILNKLVKMSNHKTTQLEPDDQTFEESLEHYEPPIKNSSSQSALYNQLMDAKFADFKSQKQTLANKANPERPYNRLYYRYLISSINEYSGAWISAGMSDPSFRLTPLEFTAAMCRRNSTKNPNIPVYNKHCASDKLENYQCACDGKTKMLDPIGYHQTGCKKDGGAIRSHDNLVHVIVKLLRLLGLSVDLEPYDMFRNSEPDDGRRPDIFLRNPHGGGRQIIIDVALTGTDGRNRTHDDKPEQPIILRRKQKESKYNEIANRNGLDFLAAPFSHTGEMDVKFRNFLLQQIRLKLQLVDGEVKKSKVRSIMKHFVRHISAAINRSASRNILLKATKTLNLIRHIQQNSSSSPSFDSISSSSSHSPDEFLQEFELQISNQDVIQT